MHSVFRNLWCYLAVLLSPVFCHADLMDNQNPGFIENRGQITDQHGRQRGDISFVLKQPGLSVFVSRGGLHYQWYRKHERSDSVESYRLDVSLEGSNPDVRITTSDVVPGYEVYYTSHLWGIQATSCRRILMEDVYPGIDWVIYLQAGQLKHDFIVHAGAVPSAIRVRYGGASAMNLKDGNLTVLTPLGSIREDAPYAYQEDGQKVSCHYRLQDSVLSFITAPHKGKLIIDPVVGWATFYGGTGADFLNAIATDSSGFIYGTGFAVSASNIATAGSYQSVFGGNNDVFLAKFDQNGSRMWGTYFGKNGFEGAYAIAVRNNNIFIGGVASADSLATSGSHQFLYGGGLRDGLLAMFDLNGFLGWSSYYGGTALDVISGVAADASSVYVTGTTRSSMQIASSNGFQQAYSDSADVFLARFDLNGNRLWSSYFGGDGIDTAASVCIGSTGGVFVGGGTTSITGVSTSQSHQAVHGGGNWDAFLVKFDVTGQRTWASYFGGNGVSVGQNSFEMGMSVSPGPSGGVYLSGRTNSPSGIATPGSAYPSGGSSSDGFVARFDSSGQRIWGSYIGGAGSDYVHSSYYAPGQSGIYLAGSTGSSSNIATAGAIQPILDSTQLNSQDIFFTFFDDQGQQVYGSYYGLSNNTERATSVSYDSTWNQLYISGNVNGNPVSLITPGAHQANSGGWQDGILICIRDTTGQFHKPQADSMYCEGQNIQVLNTIAGMFSANNIFRLELSDAIGSFATPDTIGSMVIGVTSYITGTIPQGTIPGTGYRVRVTASSPPAISQDNGSNISIYATSAGPAVSISAFPDTNVLSGTTVNFTATVTNGGNSPQYQWRRNGVFIAGANSSSYLTNTLLDGDIIDVYVESSIPCAQPSNVLSNKLTMHIPSGVDEQHASGDIRVYPNPVGEQLFIDNMKHRGLRFVLLDPTGRLVLESHSRAVRITVRTESIAPGIYQYLLYEGKELLQSGTVMKGL